MNTVASHAPVALVTLLALVLYMWMGIRVGSARSRLGVAAPATTGNPEFERYFRIHANTLEGLIVFLPALWLFAIFSRHDWIAAAIGLVWVLGRILYMQGYSSAAERRGPGFGIQALAQIVLLFGAIGFAIWRILNPNA
jgi:glutathione S-transferase